MQKSRVSLFSILFWPYFVSGVATDQLRYFDRSIPEFETQLTIEDFSRSQFITFDQHGQNLDNQDSQSLYRPNRFEGDIVGITAEQIQNFVRTANLANNPGEIHRNAVKSRYNLWPHGRVPYVISSQYSSYSKSVLASALDEFGKRSCVRFVPRVAETNYLYLMPDDGCYSMVGKAGGKQVVSLGAGCIKKGIIMHELNHAVGFFHEQSRADRDNFIDIIYDNISPGMSGQFQKYTLNTISHLGMGYDYGSIMHYGPKAFSKNGQATIQPKQRGVTIGQRHGFSNTDVNELNRLYQCDYQGGLNRVISNTQAPIKIQQTTTRRPMGNVCVDKRFDCKFLANHGWCQNNLEWSRKFCPRVCNLCSGGAPPIVMPAKKNCRDTNSYCAAWAKANFCTGSFADYMRRNCRKSCNHC